MRIARRELAEGSKIPFGYGVSYYDPMSAHVVVYWLGIHLLVRWFRSLWHFVVFQYRPTRFDEMLEEVKDRAYVRGYTAAEKQYNNQGLS